ncbi:hypothetical protein [Sphingomonas flavescens]|uniref:hypothetical protein n=1 Tax=Sphingomonas flavescens TaxID=3132797 RepID=UPI002804FA0E|nr:hypothetical protein [Sphingomonas limnosediminicola]
MIAAAFWPGVAMYDTVTQYRQVLDGAVDDWHPPAMVQLWRTLAPLGSGTAPIFALQVALYVAGFTLIVIAIARVARTRALAAVLVLALSPLLVGWQMVVLKDAHMEGALLAATGIFAFFSLAGRRTPSIAMIAMATLLIYATLVRANAVFATVPLAVILFLGGQKFRVQAAIGAVMIIAVLAVTPTINERLFAASPSGVAKSLPVYDLAALAVDGKSRVPPFDDVQIRQLRRSGCVMPFFWDPLTEVPECAAATASAIALSQRDLNRDLVSAVMKHPVDYAAHRLAHWNSTQRWLVPAGLIGAAPPDEAEPNDLGLASPKSRFAAVWQDAARIQSATPLGWPIVWTLVAAGLLPVAVRRRNDRAGRLALALVVSALTLEMSFLVVSIASDLRYHLWSMTASALALILLAPRIERRHWVSGAAVLALVIAGGLTTRAISPRAPDNYAQMVRWQGA